ncbi:thioredoxin domain-containing protein [Brassicibacter mesophilus]|uniref:thioredoxin domain-containing protein n=1 Tax=Brassicibacter mesophilus TaxID=745119 RepID=UPI003D204D2F
MERESFEDEEVAEVMNKNYIAIKVDKEERPDVDSIYMTFCQALTGQGGWPLTIFMTPDKKPFYAGTYFPKKSKYGRAGLIEILQRISKAWKNDKEDFIESSEQIQEAVKSSYLSYSNEALDKRIIDATFENFSTLFDPQYGGFADSPKFPTPHNLLFLLRYWKYTQNNHALDIVEKTLESMYKGGIFDHIGFGFSRYSVDEKWLIPHFEKMLYDNALLAIAYTEAFQATGKGLYKEVSNKIFTYVLRDMTSQDGGFYSAEDADSEGEEGKFYVWDVEEIEKVLDEEESDVFYDYYNMVPTGNFEGKNIPNLIGKDLDEIEKDVDLKAKLNEMRKRLFEYRKKRIHPYKDDKILASWNGLMIAALSYAGRAFENNTYIDAAKKSIDFIFKNLINQKGRLLARYRDGEAAYLAYLDDYAFLVWGLIELYQATFEIQYLMKALELNRDMIRLFWDEKGGGLYLYGKDSEQLIVRPKEVYDGAIPSGNSVAALNMLRLSKITGNEELGDKANQMFKTFGGNIKENPSSYSYFLKAFLYANISTKEVVIAGRKDDKDVKLMISSFNKLFLPFSSIVINDGNKDLYEIAPFVQGQQMIDNKATAYVCQNFTCNIPTTDVKKFVDLLS